MFWDNLCVCVCFFVVYGEIHFSFVRGYLCVVFVSVVVVQWLWFVECMSGFFFLSFIPCFFFLFLSEEYF